MIKFHKFNPAEKRLLMGFGALLLFLIHLFGLRLIWQQSHRLGTELALRRAEKEMVVSLLAESELWHPRQEWLRQHLPPRNANTKKVLDEKVDKIGKEFSLNPSRGQTLDTSGEFYDSEHYPASLSGGWSDLIRALQKLYLPDEGIAVTFLDLKAVDEKTHNALVTVSRFFLRDQEGASQ